MFKVKRLQICTGAHPHSLREGDVIEITGFMDQIRPNKGIVERVGAISIWVVPYTWPMRLKFWIKRKWQSLR